MYSRHQHTSWFQIKLLRCVCSLSAILINLQKKCFRRRHYQKWIWVRLYNVSSWDKCWARNGFWWFGRNAICQNSRFRFSSGLLFWAFACLSWPVLALAGRCVLQNFATWLNLRQRWHFTEDKGARHSVPCDDVLLPFCPNFTDLVVIPGP